MTTLNNSPATLSRRAIIAAAAAALAVPPVAAHGAPLPPITAMFRRWREVRADYERHVEAESEAQVRYQATRPALPEAVFVRSFEMRTILPKALRYELRLGPDRRRMYTLSDGWRYLLAAPIYRSPDEFTLD